MAAAAVSTPASAISVAAATGAATITVHKITSAFEIRSTPYFILCAVLYLRDKKIKQRRAELHVPCRENFSQMRAREPLFIPLRGTRTLWAHARPVCKGPFSLPPQKILTRNGSLKSLGADFFASKAKARRNTDVFPVILT